MFIFKKEDYVHQFKKERKPRVKQSIIPKVPKNHNKSKPVDVKVERKDVKGLIKKASEI